MEELKQQLRQNYANWTVFLKEQGPQQLMVNYEDVRRIANVFEKTPVTLRLLSETFSPENNPNPTIAIGYMRGWLMFLNDFLNINKGIPAAIMDQLAYTLYTRHSWLTLADLKLIFDFILESRYGTFYGSIDTQRIMTSFAEYARERKDIEIKMKEKEVENLKQDEREHFVPDFSKYKNLQNLFGK